ncbi:ZIP family zinc transporter [bacterium]|nr:ZIP family zinc transporter [bacterium]
MTPFMTPLIVSSFQAAFWGGFTGIALLVGSVIGYFGQLNQRVVAGVMAFGSGTLISALSFELVEKAYQKGGIQFTVIGFLSGALVYSVANFFVSKYGAKHRKRSNFLPQSNTDEFRNNDWSIAIGALIDGIPESIVIGLSMIKGGTISIVMIAAVFVSNIPEGLSSSAGMRKNKKSWQYVLTIWLSIAVISAVCSGTAFLFLQNLNVRIIALITASAAGAVLAMIVDTMIPEAFAETHNFAGLITVIGFLCAFLLDKI